MRRLTSGISRRTSLTSTRSWLSSMPARTKLNVMR
ncbi:hypothetical protein CRUP_034672 [Coryphaenoides rupestris]|nr:hypothetical protein CRUP_034672 [Coryphaenoides rupestris]